MLIKPLQQVCELIQSPSIEEQLNLYTKEEQEEIFQLMKDMMRDEIEFVLEVYSRFEMEGKPIN